MAVQVTVLSIDDEQLSAPKKTVFSKQEISIGRSRLNDLVLEHPGVSNTHARVRVEGMNGSTKFYVSDLDSTNGTMVGNKRLDPRAETVLADRDRIMIAGYILKVDVIPDEQPSAISDPVSHVIASAQPKLPEGKVTNSYVIPDEPVVTAKTPIIEAGASVVEEKKPEDSKPAFTKASEAKIDEKKENIPNGTIWNSSLLGAYREERQAPKESPVIEVVYEPEPVVSAKPKKSPDVNPISWSINEEPEEEKKLMEETSSAVPDFMAETKFFLEDNLTLDFVATKLLSIKGKVSHKGQAVSGVKVVDEELGSTVTDSKGEFSFEEIIEGTAYNFKFSKDGLILAPFELAGTLNDDDLNIEIVAKRLLSITGSITHRGAGLEGVKIDGGKLGEVTTDSTGTYKFENAVEGEEYILKATKPGFTFGTVRKSA
jgi:pSer/pThr/pTyr-binding forkhead associated (FHA) protein